ncbi:HEAT repeat domain-containing protein [Pontibacter sp. G13]|uniref:HEAT repeat domain-containing protein n=1 Tax=Pontibacter sp. G13 TaxID=3074898 RepID=UPI00288C0357|nr:HEAT repeat domain-containing protein [Pontibacter sp. G13]WNJ17123.1 HEAT repeat domain-containing protein [Pontibacter sp. G13]
MKNLESLNRALLEAGLETQAFLNEEMSPIATLVNTKTSSRPYKEILIEYLTILKGNELEMVIRALSEKGIQDVSPILIGVLNNPEDYPNLDLWAVGNAISIIDDSSTYDQVLTVCQDPKYGASRQMMMTTLRRMKTEESFQTLINSLQDDSIRGHAIEELGKWGDPRALESIQNVEVKKGLFEAKAKKIAIEKLKTAANNGYNA